MGRKQAKFVIVWGWGGGDFSPEKNHWEKISICQCVNTNTQREELLRQDKMSYCVVILRTWQANHCIDDSFSLPSHLRSL